MAVRKGEIIKCKVNYPKNPRLNGVWEGKVIEVGCFRSGYAYFRLDVVPHLAFPNSSKYTTVLERRHC